MPASIYTSDIGEIMIIKPLFYSLLNYRCLVWGTTTATNTKKVLIMHGKKKNGPYNRGCALFCGQGKPVYIL